MRTMPRMRITFTLLLVTVAIACGPSAVTTPKTAPKTAPEAQGATSSPAPAEAGKWIDLPGGGRGYFALAKGEGKHPALVVIQEWWGVSDWIKQSTERF